MVTWVVREFQDRSGQIKIVDDSAKAWGHIQVDEFTFSWVNQTESCRSNNAGQCAEGGGEILRSNSPWERAYLGSEETAMSGAAYLFGRLCEADQACSWSEKARLIPSDKRSGDQFGFSLTLLDDAEGVAVVGSPYSANFRIFKETPSLYSDTPILLCKVTFE